MTEKQSSQPIQTLQVECPLFNYWCQLLREGEGSVYHNINSIYGSATSGEWAKRRMTAVNAWHEARLNLPLEKPPQYFTLTIALQPDGTVITRAFCLRHYDYCKTCPYGQGVWIDRPK